MSNCPLGDAFEDARRTEKDVVKESNTETQPTQAGREKFSAGDAFRCIADNASGIAVLHERTDGDVWRVRWNGAEPLGLISEHELGDETQFVPIAPPTPAARKR